MSDEVAIRLSGVGKMYKMFASRGDNFLDALGLSRFVPWHPVVYRDFWALRGIDLELKAGHRVGIIGRNGAGKSTLLKLITGNLAPTEGTVQVRGQIQALLEAGSGFHPDFTGYENIRASLIYQGLSPREIAEAEEDIAEFTELGEFLAQPFKTYSAGMMARLSFAVATTVKPEILIIDEMLGAGDAYFLSKSSERMRSLVEASGAAVLLVSHSLDHITMFCEEAIWVDRGSIVETGTSLEVVKAYQQFVRTLDERRLKIRNRQRVVERDSQPADRYTETVYVRLALEGDGDFDLRQIALVRDGEVEQQLEVGNAQDADPAHDSFLVLDGSDWSTPLQAETGEYFRSLAGRNGSAPTGTIAFNVYALARESRYAIQVVGRGSGTLEVEVRRNESVAATETVALEAGDWHVERLPEISFDEEKSAGPAVRRWPGEGTLAIRDVKLLGGDGREQTVFQADTPFALSVTFEAKQSGTFEVRPAATLYRLDGILVSNHPGETLSLTLKEGERRSLRLDFGQLNLGNGTYVFSIALFRELRYLEPSPFYDLIDRGYEFEVVGNAPFRNGIFTHPSRWGPG